MSDALQFFRANPGAMIMTMLLGIGTLVFGLVGTLMWRSGVSLKPIIFVGGFFAIIVLPQAAFHYSQAFGLIPKKDLSWVPGATNTNSLWMARENLLTVRDGRFAGGVAVYGPDVDTSLVSNLRERLPHIFGDAQAAEMAILRSMSTVVLAQFSSESAANQALTKYASEMIGGLPPMDANGTYTVQRPNDVMKMVRAGRTLVAYSAQDERTLNAAFEASPILYKAPKDATSASANADPEFWLYRPAVLAAIVLVMLVVSIAWFFKMSAWSAQVPAVAGVTPASASVLRDRLMSINQLDVPFNISPAEGDSSTLVVTWRYADAKWFDLAKVHGMRRTHRILLNLDEHDGTVRPTEQFTIMDWSAGPAGAQGRWNTARGMILFQYEHQRVLGLQLDSNFRFTSNLSYAYTFNLQEMKAPLIDAVTKSGWRWRPVMLHGPRWLSWLVG